MANHDDLVFLRVLDVWAELRFGPPPSGPRPMRYIINARTVEPFPRDFVVTVPRDMLAMLHQVCRNGGSIGVDADTVEEWERH